MISQSQLNAAWRSFWPHANHPKDSDYALVGRIREQSGGFKNVPDRALEQHTEELRSRLHGNLNVGDSETVVEIFALVVEATARALSLNLYDVQLLGGLALARGEIVEMQTGEGKTFAALLPASLHALTNCGVHVMTVNSYLAQRDYELLSPVYRLLGLSVGLIDAESDLGSKRHAYQCDITYGPGYEFGFDYLRDQVGLLGRKKPSLGETVLGRLNHETNAEPTPIQRGHAVAIIDEADSVLIDEATTPLILSTTGNEPANNADVYLSAAEAAAELRRGEDFITDDATQSLRLSQHALDRMVEQQAPCTGLARSWHIYVEQALHAKWLLHRDVHYVVHDDDILLVDQNTGRIFAERSWRDGLHQAVQAKEGVTITTENGSVARITRQRYFRRYRHLCGMTGTAQGAERELQQVYGLGIAIIPTNKPCQRKTLPTRMFTTRAAKEQAIIAEIVRLHETTQPVLIGTTSIDASLRFAKLLREHSLDHQLLNGRQDAEEAEIVAQAGNERAITIATNMAGRGTDIKLARGVAARGGLHVIVTEPQESTRIDRQLLGRAARQGDPGSCQLFVSAEDPLLSRHCPSMSARILQMATGGCSEVSKDLSHELSAIQKRVERTRGDERRQMFCHDDWLETVLRNLSGVI